jgi:tetratricopeptide (TPR) repeat protein
VYKHMEVPPPDVREFSPTVSAAFWAILQKMLAKDPDDRYTTPLDLLRDLKRTAATSTDPSLEVTSPRPFKPAPLPDAEPAKSPSSSGGVPCPPDEMEMSSPSLSTPTPTPPPTPEPGPTLPGGVTPEQTRAAAAYHERAVAVMKEGGGEEYARQLLTRCLQQDPFNRTARKLLRDLNRKASPGLLSRWLGSLNVMGLKARMRSARSAGDFRKVLEHGEEVLARQPTDVSTHQEMAEAASQLGVPGFALWLLEQGRKAAPDNPSLLRTLAELHETLKEWKQAIAAWEKVRKLQPNDHEVQRKINDLSVREHIARSDRRR